MSPNFSFSATGERKRHLNIHLRYEFPAKFVNVYCGLPDFNDSLKEPHLLKHANGNLT